MARVLNSDRQADAILLVVRELCGIREQLVKRNDNNAVLFRMVEMEQKIMSAISENSEAMNQKFSEIGDTVDELVSAMTGVSGDVANLKDIISKIDTNPGPISPEDQLLLTSGLVRATALLERLKAVSSALKELDAATDATVIPPAPEE